MLVSRPAILACGKCCVLNAFAEQETFHSVQVSSLKASSF